MILKFYGGSGWVFISELNKVEIRQMTQLEAVQLDINKQFYCLKGVKEKDLNNVTVNVYYLFSKSLGLDKVLVMDSNQCYLLNDEGKTIERIN